VVEGETTNNSHFQFAGTAQQRLDDFQQAIDDPTIKAVFSARGGYGTSQIIDQVNFRQFKKHPKWIVGFSDITILLSQLYRLGFESIHGPMPKQFLNEGMAESVESLRQLLFGEAHKYNTIAHPSNKIGQAKGVLVGGNLALLAHAIGSRSDVDMRNKILFIEDVGEYRYNIDRMMIQLKRANKLKHLAGLIVGQFSDLKDENPPFGSEPYDIIAHHIAEYNYPVCYNFPVGHTSQNWALPVGRVVDLSVGQTVGLTLAN
jgi:muramoyltetrapeptide carboxypeptidase